MPTAPRVFRPRHTSRAQKPRPSIRTLTTDMGLKVPAALAEFIGAVPREKGFR